MSSLLTPKRRERAKMKSRAAHSMSPSIRPSSSSTSSTSKPSRPGRYHAMTDDDDSLPRSGTNTQKHPSSSSVPPRLVTPTGSVASSNHFSRYHPFPHQRSKHSSWEEPDERMHGSSQSNQGKTHIRASSFGNSGPGPVLVVSTTPSFMSKGDSTYSSHPMDDDDDYEPFDEDMPMDERMDRKHYYHRGLHVPSHSTDADSRASYQSVTPSKEVADIVMSASNNGGEPTGIGRIIAALNSGSTTRPNNLNREERILWDALQTAMVNDRNEHLTKRRNLERSIQESMLKLGQATARETELELELAKSKCECADLEHKYTMALAENRVLLGRKGGKSDDTPSDGDSYQKEFESLESRLIEKEEALEQQKKDHDAEVRAIQRVLADISSEKTKLEEQVALFVQNENDAKTPGSDTKQCPTDASRGGIDINASEAMRGDDSDSDTKAKMENLERQLEEAKNHANNIMEEKQILESEIESTKTGVVKQIQEVDKLKAKVDAFQNEIASQKEENAVLREQIKHLTSVSESKQTESPKPEMDHPKPEPSRSEGEDESENRAVSIESKDDEVEMLKQSLAETEASLENAKKIIASLENANGSLTLDLRSKLKSKEEELAVLQKESDERKRRLDSLATELRDLQRKQGDVEEKSRRTKVQLMKQKALVGHLQTSMADLQSAVVVHEASVCAETGVADRSSIEEISEILADTLNAVKVTLESTEELIEDTDDMSVGTADIELNSEVGRHIDAIIRNDREAAAKELRAQLDQKRIAVKRLEEALRKQHEEMKKMRAQLNGRNTGQGETDEQLRAEVLSLRQQCSTNMEVLAKKERELSVLRSSLKVDDNDAGYISDDASDDEDDAGEGDSSMPSPTDLDSYGPAEAEAFATILSQTSGGVKAIGKKRELEILKTQLMKALNEREAANKELKAEQESLANAKMIISSLEKANKGMMEDLRSRLQDSNTAIASLLDKSMEHEKNAEKYENELEALRAERQKDAEKYEAEVKKLKEQLLQMNSSRSTADFPMPDNAPTEEKKEEVLTADI